MNPFVRAEKAMIARRLRRLLRRGRRGVGYVATALAALRGPGDLRLLAELLRLHAAVPGWMASPLPLTMRRITPPLGAPQPHAEVVRLTRLVDATVHLDRRVRMGICLRRSLVRYVLLRRAGLPVTIVFGARTKGNFEGGLAGHAWLELDGVPWMEPPEHVEGFAVMYRYPER